jgi:hypothetical protein
VALAACRAAVKAAVLSVELSPLATTIVSENSSPGWAQDQLATAIISDNIGIRDGTSSNLVALYWLRDGQTLHNNNESAVVVLVRLRLTA